MRGLRLASVLVLALSAVVVAETADAGTLVTTPAGPLNFGMRAVGGGPYNDTLTLTNSSSATIVSGFMMGAGCGEFTATAAGLPATLSNGGTLAIDLTYDPVDRTADTCIVTITDDNGLTDTFTLQGDGSASQLSVSPTTRDFGNVRWNTASSQTQLFTVTNSGELPATVTVGFATGGQGFTSSMSSISVAAANGTNSVTVTFDPTSAGSKSDTVTFTAPNSVNSASATLMGVGTQSSQQFPSNPFSLGSAAVGASITTGVAISNPSASGATATLTVGSLSLDNAEFAFANHSCAGQACTPPVLAIGINMSDSYDIRCTPAGGGTRTATLSVTSNDATSGNPTSTKTVTLNCTGSPTIVNNTLTGFGNQRVNTTSTTQDLTISNPSGAASFTFTATPSTDFVLSCPVGDPSCFTARVVPGGTSAIVRVAYAPTVPGLRNGAVTITSAQAANSPRTVPVSGTGIQPTIDVTAPLAFGNVPVLLAGGSTQVLQIRNTGTDALLIPTLGIAGNADLTFAFGSCTGGQTCTPGTAISVPAGGNTNITLRCDPTGTGARNGTLTITSDSNQLTANTMTPVSLTCNGTQPNVMVSTPTLTFGPQRVGTPSVSQPFTITNPSGSTVGSTTYTVTSPSTEFTFTCSGGCSGTLAPGATVTVTVTFTPSGLLARSGTITVTTPDDPTTVRTVACTGTGVQPNIELVTPVPVTAPTTGGVLTFPDTQPLQTSAAQTIQVRNTGSQNLLITSVTNSNPTDFDLTGATTGNVLPNGTQQWSVTCSPDTLGTGTKTGTITIVNDSQNDTSVDVALTCSVAQGRLVLTAAPITYNILLNQIDFGPVRLLEAAATTVTLTNVGNRPVTLNATNPVTFAPTTEGFSTTAPSLLIIPPGGTSTFMVTFAPTLEPQGAAIMNIPSDWNALAVNVVGDGQDTAISVLPAGPTVNLGDVQWDQSRAQVFTISNLGQAQFNVMSATLLNPGTDFTLTGFTPGNLNQNGVKTLTVTATPNDTMLGTWTTTLQITTDLAAPGNLVTRTITYRSTGAGITVTPGTTVDFGGVDVDLVDGVSMVVNVMNSGTAPMTITSVTDPGGAFTRTALVGPIPVGSTMPVTIKFDPSVEADLATQETRSFDIGTGGLFSATGAPQPAIQRITVRGWGTDRHIHVVGDNDTLVLDFGDVYRNPAATDPRATKTLQVCNRGEAVLSVSMLTPVSAPYEVTSAMSFTVGPRPAAGQETCVPVTVEFRPDAYNTYDLVPLTVVNDDMVPMTTVLLSGTGVARPVMITPDSLADRARIAVGVPVRLTEIIPDGVLAFNPDGDETFRIRLELDDAAAIATQVGTVEAQLTPGQRAMYDLELVAKEAGPVTVTVNVFLDDDPVAHDTVTIDLTGVVVDVGGGVGCDAGSGRGSGWLVMVLGALGLGLVRRRRASAALGGLVLALAVVGAATSAQAQVSREIELGTFHVTPATETAMFSIETPRIAMRGAWALGLSVNHAVSVLTADDGMDITSLVNGRTQLELGFAYAVHDRVELGARLPVLQQSGETSGVYGLKPADGMAIGDVAISAKLGLVNQAKLALAFAVEGTIPTGKDGQFAGGRTASGQGRFLLGVAAGSRLSLALNAGFLGRGKAEFSNLTQGNAAVYGAGVSLRALEKLWVIGELFGELGLAGGDDAASARPLEAALGVRYRLGQSAAISLGGGRGILNGVGAPMVRGFFMLTVSPKASKDVELHPYIPPPPRDVGDDDGDDIVNADDQCKLDAEDRDDYEDADGCPEADNDTDGVLDADDKCPNQPEDKDGFEDGDGCVDTDNDNDGVPDIDDKCPAEAEDKDGFEDGDGCEEPDNDKDGVPDVLDQCAMEAETINGNADEDGCPDKGDSVIMVMPDRIEVLEPVTFQGVTSKFTKNTTKTLAQIGATMRADRKIKRVRITVHVHPRNGGDQALSDKRADELRTWLVGWGVEPERLDAKGIGSKRPLVPRNAKGAEQINDRVEFIIFERQ